MELTRKIYLLRHCASTDNEKGINGSKTDSPLSESGLFAAKELVRQLSQYRFDLIIVSPLQRTVQTITPYLNSLEEKPAIITEPLTTERDLGIFTNTISGDGKIAADQDAMGKGKTQWQPKEGESTAQVYSRAIEFLEKLRRRTETSILISGHQNFLRCLELILRNEPIDDEHFYSESPARLKPGEIRVYSF